jgi:hypothetical protein
MVDGARITATRPVSVTARCCDELASSGTICIGKSRGLFNFIELFQNSKGKFRKLHALVN